MLLDAYVCTPVFERVILELLSVVGYDFPREPKSANYVVPYKFLYLVTCDGCNWLCLYPLGEVIDGHD